MKKSSYLLVFASLALGLASCKDDDSPTPSTTEPGDEGVMITENITENTTWETGKTYVLSSRIVVTEGATLTVQPGVVVKGGAGEAQNATALIISRGAKIDAQGTSSSPIIFTSSSDNIQPGQIASPNLEPNATGLWGGLLILGNAKGSFKGNVSEVQIEGIPSSDTNGLYGGDDDVDEAGKSILKYVSIRHGGANIGEGNEINGLTLGAVGSSTVIENIEIVGNQDDGIEWFGGKVSVKNAIVWNAGDDAIDTDQAWRGTLDNFIVINSAGHALELDGPEGEVESGSDLIGNHSIMNGSISTEGSQGLVSNDEDTNADLSNLYFFNVQPGQTFDIVPTVPVVYSNFQITLPEGSSVADFFKGTSVDHATSVAANANTVGADKAAFAGWSWAGVEALENF